MDTATAVKTSKFEAPKTATKKAVKAAAKDEKPAKAAKKGAPAKDEKPAKKGAAKAAPVARTRASDDTKMIILDKNNPYREGNKCYVTFELLKKHKTVGSFRAAMNEHPEKYDKSFPGWCTVPHGNQPALVKLG
jgi:hypothetical protein